MRGAIGIYATRAIARVCRLRALTIEASGLQHLPASGPVLVAARHFHHLYDGATLIETIPRPVRIFVALDWARTQRERKWMERACAQAAWPVALRGDNFGGERAGASAFERREALQYTRRALRAAADLLTGGEVLVVFPEGYPTIDPSGARKIERDAFLPFRAGFVSALALAERGGVRVPVVPAGLAYESLGDDRWRVVIRYGAPEYFDARIGRDAFAAAIGARVRALSAIPAAA